MEEILHIINTDKEQNALLIGIRSKAYCNDGRLCDVSCIGDKRKYYSTPWNYDSSHQTATA